MSAISSIEWTDATWTPIRARRKDTGKVGVHCERVSPGCQNCYSSTFNRRNLPHHGTGLDFVRPSRDLVEIFVDEHILVHPLQWKKPRKIFVCSQTDLFAEFVTDEMIDQVFAVMALCPQHTFQVLTKRADRLDRYWNEKPGFWRDAAIAETAMDIGQIRWEHEDGRIMFGFGKDRPTRRALPVPMPHVWMGVSVENQQTADERIPLLLQTPAAVRFVSYEPALGPLRLDQSAPYVLNGDESNPGVINAFTGQCYHPATIKNAPSITGTAEGIQWVIVGGESGAGARPFNAEWARSIVRQCKAAGVPVFVKQLGAFPHDGFPYGFPPIRIPLKDRKGGDMSEWPEDLRVREFPQAVSA